MKKEAALIKRLSIATALFAVIVPLAFLVSGCGGLSEAEIEFYTQIEPVIEETKASLDLASQLVSAEGIKDTTELVSFGAVAADEYVNPGADSEDRVLSAEEVQAMVKQFDSLTAQLSVDISALAAPEGCAECSELVTKLEDSRKRAVEEMQSGEQVMTAAMAVTVARNTELAEVKAIPMPGVSYDLTAVAAPWESAQASYEKALAAYQAVGQAGGLKENLDALIASQQALVAATRTEIEAMHSLDDGLMMQTQNDAIQAASEEVLRFNGLIIKALESIQEIDGNLMSLAREVEELQAEIPEDLHD
ncbi:MAG: hypothetical protein ACYC57_10510 [Thermoleophilia bacterium]